MSGTERFLLRVSAQHRQVDGALVDDALRELPYEHRIDDGRGDRRMTEHVLFDARRIDDVGVQIDEGLAVREVERCRRVDLTPDEHVFGGQRNLRVAVPDVRANGRHDLLLGEIDLWIQVWHAELTATSAPGGHLDDAEGRPLVGEDDLLAIASGVRRQPGEGAARS